MRVNSTMGRLLLWAAGAFLLAGCDGDDGAAGAAGASGAAGPGGSDGVACWDLNQDGVADAAEDLNGDGTVDVLDCREPLPGTALAVSGQVSTAAGPLDRFAEVWFVPTGGGVQTDADVETDGSYTVALDEGDYTAFVSRPGYEEAAGVPFTAASGAANTLDLSLTEIPDGEFIGSGECGVCHTVQYHSFAQSGHPFKLNKVENNQPPSYPFTSLNGVLQRVTDDDADGTLVDPVVGTDNGLGTPTTWDDVSYVIGGYYWKARFVDMAGAVVTGSSVQYNFATDGMVAYHNNEQDKPYNCGNCHTTGWRHTDAALNPTGQDGLAFMQGTFFEGGVHCEACHSAGSAHAKFSGTIVRNATPRTLAELSMPDAGYGLAVACGECHTRDGERDYPAYASGYDTALATTVGAPPDPRPNEMGGRIAASGGLVKHHEQYDEVLGIDPDTLDTTRSPAFMATHGDCGTCHDPHGSSVNADNPLYTGVPGVDTSSAACLGCHADYDASLRAGGMLNLECKDCHLPDLAKSAVAIAGELERPTVGDVASHIFTINLDSTAPQFTADGKFAYPAIDEAWACATCHNTAPGAVIPFAVPPATIDTYVFHNNIP